MDYKEITRNDLPNSYCNDCGIHLSKANEFATYTRDEQKHYKCGPCYEKDPVLQRTCEVFSRVAGYLRPVEDWNVGKQAEFEDRQVFRSSR